ncbi:MAG TPA: zf-HC2 domain-containing protein [Vicinamibacterales bacterium]|jgi:hypothetical protein
MSNGRVVPGGDDGGRRSGCPDPETLAALMDGRVSGRQRRRVESHIEACEDCRAVVAESVIAERELELRAADRSGTEAVDSMSGTVRRPWLWPTLGVLTAAAVLIVAIVVPWRRGLPSGNTEARPERAELVAAVGPHRPFEARLTGGFAFGPLQPVLRSGEGEASAPAEVRLAAAKLEAAARTHRSSEAQAAFAASELILGHLDSAIGLLEDAAARAATNPAWWSDLAAARLVRARHDDSPTNLDRALDAADRALALRPSLPEALFNRALALEALGRSSDARAAWKAYLAVDAHSPWAAEARRH